MVGSLSNREETQHSFLPSQWKSIHLVFHISLLEPVKTSKIPNWNQEPPPPREGMGSLSNSGFKDKERKIIVLVVMERFQSRPRKIHLKSS
ncbi:hypothetical protein O181_050263 [Austropuccinia psidii MF-1]|uniref:Uncharacterized protein n=1 Tax=Austropuccinia psidii MF-1 TaxID=1389203 RepID=A0A9Q3HM73_9BASI|nr:hypothetical protein [Austropuccinia psidii MF-1]